MYNHIPNPAKRYESYTSEQSSLRDTPLPKFKQVELSEEQYYTKGTADNDELDASSYEIAELEDGTKMPKLAHNPSKELYRTPEGQKVITTENTITQATRNDVGDIIKTAPKKSTFRARREVFVTKKTETLLRHEMAQDFCSFTNENEMYLQKGVATMERFLTSGLAQKSQDTDQLLRTMRELWVKRMKNIGKMFDQIELTNTPNIPDDMRSVVFNTPETLKKSYCQFS